MKSRTRIDSAVFQLTPTRTRFDLIINADGKVEKMDSGLLDPFLAHLKVARDQFAKGGYSIVLKPSPDSNPTWFTKGTVERFFRFVSSPEVLERVCTIESEILQIEGAISLHKNNDIGLINGEDHQENFVESTEGTKHVLDSNEDKAIVLYQPGLHPPEASGSPAKEGNSKVQLLRVLETRKSVLQKEQGMAFARAVAAGFDIDHMTPLMSFSECFGAARFMDACLKFMDLWTKKHEAGQWLEIEATDLSSSNALGITPATVTNNQNEINEGFPESLTNLHPEKASVDAGADDKPSTDHQAPNGNKEYVPGQYPHLMFPPWPIHSPPGALPVYQSYPMQGIPYYQNYPGNGPYFTPPYQFVEDPRINASHSQRTRQRRHSMDSRGSNTESDSLEPNDPKTRSLDDKELNKEVSQGRESMKKSSHMGKKNSGMVVIRNINYITSKNHYSSCSESQSASDSETDGDSELQSADFEQNKSSSKSSKRRANQTMSADALDSFDKEDVIHGKEADGEKWQAFQNCLLRDAGDDRKIIDQGMRTFKREAQVKQRQIRDGTDLLVLSGQYSQETQEGRKIDCVGDDVLHLRKASKDEVVLSSREGHYGDGRASINGQLNIQSIEEGRRGVYSRTATDDFIIPGQENQSNVAGSSSDLLAVNAFERTSNKLDRSLSHTDESFIVPMRSSSVGQVGLEGRAAIDMAAELPSVLYKPDNHSIRVGKTHVNYEPDDLSLMPKHGSEKGSIGFDPALDYEMQAHATSAVGPDDDKDVVTVNDESKKLTRPKVIPDSLNKKRITGVPKKGKPSKLSPLDEARARAESLRSFKADLQKVKKEKEEEDMRRLEALKIARQNRISARSGSIPALSPFRPQQTRNQLPKKHHSQGSHGVSKFSDSEPGSSSPLLRVPKRILSLTSSNSPITSKPSRLNSGSQRSSNRLTHSASSLPEPKKNNEVISPDPKASMARIRRLSEPKLSSSRYTSLKPQTTETVSKRKLSHVPESKKVSAIINLDKSKAATLPGLKIASEGPLEPAKEMTETVNGYHSSTTYAGSNQNKKNDNMDHDDTDGNPVIEKTIVILECEKPAARSLQPSEETASVLNGHYDDHTQGGDTVASGYAHIHAPVAEPDLNGTGRKSVDPKFMEQSSSCEVTAEYAEKESPKVSSISTGGKPQQPPIVLVSSLEDPCADISEHRKAPPTSIEADTAKVCVPDLKNSKLERIPEALEKSQVKESSRGFRRLLKLGRKNHSADGSVIEESNNSTNAGASSEVYTLKNLISQDEAGTTSRKASRHFFLSPFLGKNSEKKLMT